MQPCSMPFSTNADLWCYDNLLSSLKTADFYDSTSLLCRGIAPPTRQALQLRCFQLECCMPYNQSSLPYVQDLRSKRLRRIQHEEGEAVQSQEVNEDAEREVWLEQIALASLRAADRLSGIQQVCLILTPLIRSSKVSDFPPNETPP